MSTKSIAPKPAAVKVLPPGAPALEIALRKARAASILLKADADYLQIPVRLEPGEEKGIRAWIQDFAFDALAAALEEAEAARREAQGPPMFGPKRKAGA